MVLPDHLEFLGSGGERVHELGRLSGGNAPLPGSCGCFGNLEVEARAHSSMPVVGSRGGLVLVIGYIRLIFLRRARKWSPWR